jgi:hypothetical protein
MNARKLLWIGLMGAYLVMWIGGVGHYAALGGPPLDAPWTASLFLLLAGVMVVATSPSKELQALLIAALIGWMAEVLGVRFGAIFSPYYYTETLRPQSLGVPWVMLSAWLVLVSYTRQVWSRLKLPGTVAGGRLDDGDRSGDRSAGRQSARILAVDRDRSILRNSGSQLRRLVRRQPADLRSDPASGRIE